LRLALDPATAGLAKAQLQAARILGSVELD
jgi:hypothetical protein